MTEKENLIENLRFLKSVMVKMKIHKTLNTWKSVNSFILVLYIFKSWLILTIAVNNFNYFVF